MKEVRKHDNATYTRARLLRALELKHDIAVARIDRDSHAKLCKQ